MAHATRIAASGCPSARAPFRRHSQRGTRLPALNRRSLLTTPVSTSIASLLFSASSLAPAPPVLASPSVQLRPITSEESAALAPALKKAVTKTKAPTMLRLIFHDAGTYRVATGDGGLNASVQYELQRPENAGLNRGWSTVAQVQKSLAGTAAASLSAADLIVALAAYSVKLCGGPDMPLVVGRIDTNSPDPENRLPGETFSAQELKVVFAGQGFSAGELVCLSGAHTIGQKGYGDPAKFDNFYYTALLKKPWLDKSDSMASMIGLPSDHVLPEDDECLVTIKKYAADNSVFQADFAKVFNKLSLLGYA